MKKEIILERHEFTFNPCLVLGYQEIYLPFIVTASQLYGDESLEKGVCGIPYDYYVRLENLELDDRRKKEI